MADLAVAILAAGQSRRFGGSDKLTAELRGKMLGLHVSDLLANLPIAHRWIIASAHDHPCVPDWQSKGWTVIENPQAEKGMGTSVACAAERARNVGVDGLMICLADMPLIPLSHYRALIERAQQFGPSKILVTTDGIRRLPPALFGQSHFAKLTQMTGDTGARELLADGEAVRCDADSLVDVDDAETLQRLN
jgi:CTP:molybdopterin cytidylyltransferase MocA